MNKCYITEKPCKYVSSKLFNYGFMNGMDWTCNEPSFKKRWGKNNWMKNVKECPLIINERVTNDKD